MVQKSMWGGDVLTVGWAAKELSVSRQAVYDWVKQGKILGIQLGGILFIPRSEIKRMKIKRTDGGVH
ncbi:hypothetical protein ES708_15509 [subsurface metagenome]